MNSPPAILVAPCPVCGSDRFRPRYTARDTPESAHPFQGGVPSGSHHPVVECLECGVAYTRPRDSDETLAGIYSSLELRDYLDQQYAKEAMFGRQLDRIEELRGGKGRLLEIGCAAGLFCRPAAERGWEVVGCDPWEEAVDYGRSHWQLDLRELSADSLDTLDGEFDAIVLWDVIEHLSRPGLILENARRKMKADGILALSTPDYGSWSRQLLGSRWQFFERAHLVLFRRKVLTALLENLGFRVLECRGQTKFVSGDYLARYLGKWNAVLSRFLQKIAGKTGMSDLLFRLPAGMMIAYARKKPKDM